jgi:hypothetical protein
MEGEASYPMKSSPWRRLSSRLLKRAPISNRAAPWAWTRAPCLRRVRTLRGAIGAQLIPITIRECLHRTPSSNLAAREVAIFSEKLKNVVGLNTHKLLAHPSLLSRHPRLLRSDRACAMKWSSSLLLLVLKWRKEEVISQYTKHKLQSSIIY